MSHAHRWYMATRARQTPTCHPLHIWSLRYSQRQHHVGNVFFTVSCITVFLPCKINFQDSVMSPARVFCTTSVKSQSLTPSISNPLFHWFFFSLLSGELSFSSLDHSTFFKIIWKAVAAKKPSALAASCLDRRSDDIPGAQRCMQVFTWWTRKSARFFPELVVYYQCC